MSQARAIHRLNGQRPRVKRVETRVAPHEVTSAPTPLRPGPASIRPGVVARCDALGVRLTAKRRRLAEILDMVPSPIDVETAWWKMVELKIETNRSSLHRFVHDLVAVGVLREIGFSDRRGRYATPADVTLEIADRAGAPIASQDATLMELIIETLSRNGVDPSGRRIVISVAD